jgi:hypothetical protein
MTTEGDASEQRRCTRCILPESCRNIRFDADGICNYCRAWERYGAGLEDWNRLRGLFRDRIERVRGRRPYDCLVGLSGGKDSCYVALVLVRDWRLRVLAVTCDNGFLTDLARANIATIVERLGLDHVYWAQPPEERRRLFAAATCNLGLPCVACSPPVYLALYKLAFDRGIPLVVHGRSPFQMFKELVEGSADPFVPLIESNAAPYRPSSVRRAIVGSYVGYNALMKRVLRGFSGAARIHRSLFPGALEFLTARQVPDMIGYFIYHPYDEAEHTRVLQKEIEWQAPPDSRPMAHHDCRIHDAAAWLYDKVVGHPLLAQELAVAVRMGFLDRKKALERLSSEDWMSVYPDASMDDLCADIGMEKGRLEAACSRGRALQARLNALARLRASLGFRTLRLREGAGGG